jgi:hypothetical protein
LLSSCVLVAISIGTAIGRQTATSSSTTTAPTTVTTTNGDTMLYYHHRPRTVPVVVAAVVVVLPKHYGQLEPFHNHLETDDTAAADTKTASSTSNSSNGPDYGGLLINLHRRDHVERVVPSDEDEGFSSSSDRCPHTSYNDDDNPDCSPTDDDDNDDEYYVDWYRTNKEEEDDEQVDGPISNYNVGCRRMAWHGLNLPNCNTFHEISLSDSTTMKYLGYVAMVLLLLLCWWFPSPCCYYEENAHSFFPVQKCNEPHA